MTVGFQFHPGFTAPIRLQPNPQCSPTLFAIPKFCRGRTSFACSYERGGNGEAQIVCGLAGKKLKGLHCLGEVNGVQGLFMTPWALVTVTVYLHGGPRRESRMVIQEQRLIVDNEHIALIPATIYKGVSRPYASLKHFFGAAIEAAFEKARCQNCTHFHFSR